MQAFNSRPWLVVALEITLFVGTFLFLPCALYHSLDYISFKRYGQGTEGIVLASAMRVPSLSRIYQDPQEYPYFISIYGPVYYFLFGYLIKLLGPSLTWGRLLSFMATSGTITILYKMVKIEPGQGLARYLLIPVFAALPEIAIWATSARVDMVGVFLGFLGLYLIRGQKNHLFIFWPALYFLGAIFTKPNMISAPLAAIVWLYGKGERKRAFILATLLLLGGTIFFGGLNWFSHGGFWKNIFLTHNDRWYWELELNRLIFFFALHAVFLWLALLQVKREFQARQLDLMTYYFLVSSFNLLLLGKVGSDINYHIEPALALVPLAVWGFSRVRENTQSFYKLLGMAWAVCYLVIMLSFCSAYYLKPTRRVPSNFPFTNKTGYYLAEDPSWLVLNELPVLFSDTYSLASSYSNIYWDLNPLLDDVKNRRIDGVLMSFDPTDTEPLKNKPWLRGHWPDIFVKELLQYYEKSPDARWKKIGIVCYLPKEDLTSSNLEY